MRWQARPGLADGIDLEWELGVPEAVPEVADDPPTVRLFRAGERRWGQDQSAT